MGLTDIKVKKYLKKHKDLYIGIGLGIGFASITWYIMRDRHATLLSGVDGLKTADVSATVRPISFSLTRRMISFRPFIMVLVEIWVFLLEALNMA